MAIRKMEFYEGAALYRLIRFQGEARVRVHSGMIILDERLAILLKYCTRTRTPWTFGFTPSERSTLAATSVTIPLVVGLVCGSDGVAALRYQDYIALAGDSKSQIAISCSRAYNGHYAVSGPSGVLSNRIAPSAWDRLLVARD